VAQGTIEVAFAIDTAVVLARRILELNADPEAGCKKGLTSEADGTCPTMSAVNQLQMPKQLGSNGLPGESHGKARSEKSRVHIP
jgi:hypothetical protein